MKIVHFRFSQSWSWGLIAIGLEQATPQHQWHHCQISRETSELPCDIILSQQVTLMRHIQRKSKTVCRLGGNRTFDEDSHMAFETEIKQVYAVIATNKHLFDIAKQINPNTFLIPNGLDIDEWKPRTKKPRKFTAGFSGNIIKPEYREYKGYDFIMEACSKLNIPLKTTLYKTKQIPHNEMQEQFYYKINVLVHPTKGEGSSNVIMEALACGIPVITTKTAGYHGEMLTDNTNVLFCERSTESVTKQLQKLKRSPQLQRTLSLEGRKFAEHHHNIKEIAKQYDKIFTNCYNANKNNPADPLTTQAKPMFRFPVYRSKR